MTTDVAAAVAAADVVVEAVPEDLDLKRDVFSTLGAAAGDDTVIASNTSGLSIEELGSASGRSNQVVGLHFFNPVPAMRLVEVVRAPDTTDATVARGVEFARAVGKETVEVRDMPGFVTTRLGTVLMCEAMRAYEQGVASAEHVDTAMKLGYNHPMGRSSWRTGSGSTRCCSSSTTCTRCTAKRSQPRRSCARWWPTASSAEERRRLLRVLSGRGDLSTGAAGAGAATATGIVKENVAPCPGSLSTQMRPPCWAVKRCAIVRPMPVPRAWSPLRDW